MSVHVYLTENTLKGSFRSLIRNFVMFQDHYEMSSSQ